MSALMIAGVLTGLSPMPKPIPLALVGRILGGGLPRPALIALGASAHLLYGGTFGGVLAVLARPVTVGKGIALAIVLWLPMQVLWLPLLGWGAFGSAITPKIAGATLVLHLIYGTAAGWLIDRRIARAGQRQLATR
jgi:hypothetical protein